MTEESEIIAQEEAYLVQDAANEDETDEGADADLKKQNATKPQAAVHLVEITNGNNVTTTKNTPVIAANQVSSGDDDDDSIDQNNANNMSNKLLLAAQAPGGRRRLFSIDITAAEAPSSDAANGESSTSVTAQHLESDMMPKIDDTSADCILDSLNPSILLGDKNIDMSVRLPQQVPGSAKQPQQRDRGFSFEFLSFDMNYLPDNVVSGGNLNATPSNQPNNNAMLSIGRERGDSIIFDPMSFTDGGIHEENALRFHNGNGNGFLNSNSRSRSGTTGSVSEMIHHLLPPIMRIPSPPSPSIISSSNIQNNSNVNNNAVIPSIPKMPRKLDSSTNNMNNIAHQQQQSLNHRRYGINENIDSNSESITMPNPLVSLSHSEGISSASGASQMQGLRVTSSSQHSNSNASNRSSSQCCFDLSQLNFELINKGGRIGIYLPDARRERIAKFHLKRQKRIWRKRIKYDCRKKLADSRPRIKGRFVKRSEMRKEEDPVVVKQVTSSDI